MSTTDKFLLSLVAIGLLLGGALSITTGTALFSECHVNTEC